MEAYDHGLAGVVLSNHGGRQLDFSRSGIEILAEVVENLSKKRNLTFPNEKFQLFIDGGVRRATDVLKAVALGATAVGIGRPFIYAYSAYGQEGVDKALQILHVSVSLHGRRKGYSILEQDEFEMNLRLLGAPTLKNVVPEMVDTSNLSSHIVSVPDDRLYVSNCACSLLLLLQLKLTLLCRRESAGCAAEGVEAEVVEECRLVLYTAPHTIYHAPIFVTFHPLSI